MSEKKFDEILLFVQAGLQYAILKDNRNEIVKYFEKIEGLVKDEIKRPKRNCERFNSFFDAADAWCKECLKSANPKPFEEWIFEIEKGNINEQ
jgi:hypothetical protein